MAVKDNGLTTVAIGLLPTLLPVPVHITSPPVPGVGIHVIHGIVSVLPLAIFVHVTTTVAVVRAGFGKAVQIGDNGDKLIVNVL